MTLYSFIGCALTAYGPPAAMFTITIASDPVKIIILILSAFFWLLSLLLSSILWKIVGSFTDEIVIGLVFSVIFQEVFRFLIYLLLDKTDSYLKKLTENEETQIFANKHILAYVVGLGFGLMSGAFSLVNVLAASIGPGTLGFQGEAHNFFIVSSIMTLCMILLNTAWGVIFFASIDSGNRLQTLWVVGSHMFISCLTLLNSKGSGAYYAATLVPAYLVLAVSVVMAVRVAGGSLDGIKQSIMCGRAKSSQNLSVNAEG